jgi:predicted transposase/invertase (TIGR01784 family)
LSLHTKNLDKSNEDLSNNSKVVRYIVVIKYQLLNFCENRHPFLSTISRISLYFSQYKPVNPEWFAIVIFDRQANDVTIPSRYQEIAERRLQRIYLDEIPEGDRSNVGLGILKLVVEPEESAGELAQNLIERTKQELKDSHSQKQLLELIKTIVIYKFPQLSYQEIEIMLNLEEIRQTRVYQDAKLEGIEQGKLEQKIAMIPLLQELGLTIEQIAQRLEIEANLVRENLK